MLWESSIYKFRVPVDAADQESDSLKEINFDVTLSAPTDKDPGETLESVFEEVFEYLEDKKVSKILDFGAAKLRNTLYLLKKGFKVCAVEFEKSEKESDYALEMYKKARKYKSRFGEMVYPHDFTKPTKLGDEVDLILMINVLSTMPVPAERLLVLTHCREKLRDGGYLLYVSIHGHSFYKAKCTDDVRVGDGYYMNKGYYKSFYRDFEDFDVDFMLLSSGFDLEHKFVVKSNLVRLYRKQRSILLDKLVSVRDVEKICDLGRTIENPQAVEPKVVKKTRVIKPIIPNPVEFHLDALWTRKLKQIPVGHKGATDFHRLVNLILRRIFEPELKNFRIEEKLYAGRKRVDIVATNLSEKGFFTLLRDSHNIKCPWVFMECKNYEIMKNEEVDQLLGRLTPDNGEFGLLIYRGAKHQRDLLQRCQSALRGGNKKYVLPLNDNDLGSLLKMRREDSTGEIVEFLDNRFRELKLS